MKSRDPKHDLENPQARQPSLLNRLVLWFKLRWETRRQYRALLEMDDRMLKDIGLSRADVQRLISTQFCRQEPLKRQEGSDLQIREQTDVRERINFTVRHIS